MVFNNVGMGNRELIGSYSSRDSLNLRTMSFQELSSGCKASFLSSLLPLIPSISHDCIHPAAAPRSWKSIRNVPEARVELKATVWEAGNALFSSSSHFRGRKSAKQGCDANEGQEICSHTGPESSQRDLPVGLHLGWLSRERTATKFGFPSVRVPQALMCKFVISPVQGTAWLPGAEHLS